MGKEKIPLRNLFPARHYSDINLTNVSFCGGICRKCLYAVCINPFKSPHFNTFDIDLLKRLEAFLYNIIYTYNNRMDLLMNISFYSTYLPLNKSISSDEVVRLISEIYPSLIMPDSSKSFLNHSEFHKEYASGSITLLQILAL